MMNIYAHETVIKSILIRNIFPQYSDDFLNHFRAHDADTIV